MQEKLLTGSTLKENIGLAIGAASMCWHETPKGVFDATQANQIVEELNSYVLNMNKKSDSIAKKIEISKNKINSLNKFTGNINIVSDIRCADLSFMANHSTDSNIAQLSFLEKKFDVVDGLIVSEEIKSEEPAYEVNEYGDKKWKSNGELHREDGPAIEYTNGTKVWYINGNLHREGGPAIEHANGSKTWFVNDKLHRLDGPAVEYADRTKKWYVNGKLHRTDGPAVEYANGDKYWYVNDEQLTETEFNEKVKFSKEKLHKEKLSMSGNIEEQPVCELDNNESKRWYLNGKLHRLDGPAVEHFNGHKYWYVNNKLHRIDGPAVEYVDGYKSWWVDDKRHRTDGPAIELVDGTKQWWIDGIQMTKEQFELYTMIGLLKNCKKIY